MQDGQPSAHSQFEIKFSVASNNFSTSAYSVSDKTVASMRSLRSVPVPSSVYSSLVQYNIFNKAGILEDSKKLPDVLHVLTRKLNFVYF
jgi:hypothetical protein